MSSQATDLPCKYGRSVYGSPARTAALLPTPRFFMQVLAGPMFWLWQKAREGQCDDLAWVQASNRVAEIFESLGGSINVEGLDHVAKMAEPCVFIANHMSTLETFLLPGMLRPLLPVTFIVKKSLTEMPVFGPIMRSRDPVVVRRVNPREDLATVLSDGVERLAAGISVVVFPQHTRSLTVRQDQFNSIGVKLARKAGAPVIPLALKTDAWGIGTKIKELGKIRPDLPVRFKFAAPLQIRDSGKAEHQQIYEYVAETVSNWQSMEGTNL